MSLKLNLVKVNFQKIPYPPPYQTDLKKDGDKKLEYFLGLGYKKI